MLRDGMSLQGGGQQQAERLAVISARPGLATALDGFVQSLKLRAGCGRLAHLCRLQLKSNLRRVLLLKIAGCESVKLGLVSRRRGSQCVFLIPGAQLIMTLLIGPGLLRRPVRSEE